MDVLTPSVDGYPHTKGKTDESRGTLQRGQTTDRVSVGDGLTWMILASLSNSASNASGAGEGENEGKGSPEELAAPLRGLLTSETFSTAAGEKSMSCNSARIAEYIDFLPDGP